MKTVLAGMAKVVHTRGLSSWRCLRISRDESNVIRVQANNLDSLVTYRMEQPQTGFACAALVPYEALAKSIKGAEGRLLITIETEERVVVCSRVSQTPIELIIDVPSLQDWPPIPQASEERSDVPWEFKKALQEALSCSSQDPGRQILSGAFVDVSDAATHHLIGTNGRHLYVANSFRLNLAASVSIPHRKFLGWSGFIDDGPWCMAVQPPKHNDPGWIEIASPRWSIMTRPVEGMFPDWKQVLPDPSREKTVVMLRPDAMDRMLELLPRLPGHSVENSPVRLRIENGQLLLRARNRSADPWMEVAVPSVSIVGTNVELAVNRAYVSKALGMGLRELHLSKEPSPGLVCQNDGKLLIIAPLRIDDVCPLPAAPVAPPPVKTDDCSDEQAVAEGATQTPKRPKQTKKS